MDRKEYWQECLSEAADECGASLTTEQLAYLAGAIDGAHENMGLAFHHPESPYPSQIADLEKRLRIETEKVVCPQCKGRRVITRLGGYHASISQCWTCLGAGRISP